MSDEHMEPGGSSVPESAAPTSEVVASEGPASPSDTQPDNQDRRREYRLNRVLGAELHHGEETVKARLYVINISRTGIKATNHFPLTEGETQTLKLFLSAKEPPLTIDGKVAWQKELKVSGMFELGMAFTHMSEEDYQRLDKFIEVEKAKLATEPKKNLDLVSIWKFGRLE